GRGKRAAGDGARAAEVATGVPRASARRCERRLRRGGKIVPLTAEDGALVTRRELGAEAAQAAEVDAGAGRDEERECPAHARERLPRAGHLAELPGGVGERAEQRGDDEDAVHGGDRAWAAGRGGHACS